MFKNFRNISSAQAMLVSLQTAPMGLGRDRTLDEQIEALQEASRLVDHEASIDEDSRTIKSLANQGVLTHTDLEDAELVL